MSRIQRQVAMGMVAAVAAGAVALPAAAQVGNPGFFGGISGWYHVDSGKDAPSDVAGKPRPDDGYGGRVFGGYRFGVPFDISFALTGNRLSKKDDAFARNWTADLAAGYTFIFDNVAVRPSLGVRYARFDHRYEGGFDYRSDYDGVGPRAALDAAFRFGPNSPLSIFASVGGGPLFGKLKEKNSLGMSDKGSRTVWNVEGQIGLAYEVVDNLHLGIGYRAEKWWGVADSSYLTGLAGKDDRLMHGPFVRVAYNFGPPPRVRASAPAPVPAPAPVAVPKRNFIVFFDFDKSNITPEGARVVSDAAASFKAGNNTRVTATGHTDRSGSERYNMALSLRRATAVKQALIAQGVPADAIYVVGRGESQPLVPTADGVREPQNRRVEIVIE